MEERPRDIDVVMGEVLAAMPAGLSGQDRLASLVASAVRASGEPPESAWVALARVVSHGHEDRPACVKLVLRVEDGEDHERRVLTFHANGWCEEDRAVAVGTVGEGPTTQH